MKKLILLLINAVIIGRADSNEFQATDAFQRNYWNETGKKYEAPDKWELIAEQGIITVLDRNRNQLLKFSTDANVKIHDIVINKDETKAIVHLAYEKNGGTNYTKLVFQDVTNRTVALPSENKDGDFISEIGALSKTGKYTICRVGVTIKNLDRFKVIYSWHIIDLFDQLKTVRQGIDFWGEYQYK